MNAALCREEKVHSIRVVSGGSPARRLDFAFASEGFAVPVTPGQIAGHRTEPGEVQTPRFDLLLTSRLNATETLCVGKSVKPV